MQWATWWSSPVPQRHKHYEGATTPTLRITGHLFVSLPVPTRFLLASCSPMPALPGGWRSRPGQDRCSAGDPIAGSLSRGREWDISGFQATPPVPLPRSRTPAGPTIPRQMTVSSMLPLPLREQRLQRHANFGATAGLQHLLSTLHGGCCHCPCKTRFRLAGWPLPGGS